MNPSDYWKSLHASKSDIKKNLELGCLSNLIKDFKVYDLIKTEEQSYGIGVSSVVVPIEMFLEYFQIESVIS